MNLRVCFSALLALCLFSCSTSTRTLIGPDGTENQLITCVATEDCYDKARDVCHGPYKIVNTSSETSGSDGKTTTAVKLLVKCGK